jgi:hypothetical protein
VSTSPAERAAFAAALKGETAADPAELRILAADIDAGRDGWRERVDSLPREVLTRETLGSEPGVIAERLRSIAVYIDRRRAGVPFGEQAGPLYENWKR